MTTWRQIAANRRNAAKSTGPRTAVGKRRSRRNALRHGLCAETVIEVVEDVEDYKAFEVAVASEYDAQSVVERELVLRLASLLWRIRRATGIETALLELHAEKVRDQPPGLAVRLNVLEAVECGRSSANAGDCPDDAEDQACTERESVASSSFRASMRDLAHCFKTLADGDQRIFERLGRYESALCRQVVRTLFALQSARRRFGPPLGSSWRDKA